MLITKDQNEKIYYQWKELYILTCFIKPNLIWSAAYKHDFIIVGS